MKTACHVVAWLCMVGFMLPQAKAQTVIGAAGTELSFGEGAIAFTVGEAVRLTEENTALVHNVGFHQVFLTTTPTRAVLTEQFTLDVFPNPVGDYLQITTDQVAPDLMIRLYNGQGQFLRTLPFTSQNLRMDMTSLTKGSYIISIIDGNQLIQSFTILKP